MHGGVETGAGRVAPPEMTELLYWPRLEQHQHVCVSIPAVEGSPATVARREAPPTQTE